MEQLSDTLFLIMARGGSKGIPGKNIKILGNMPLIYYSIDFARNFVKDEFICVSTDSELIQQVVLDRGLKVPFMRPSDLAADDSSSYDVELHALNYFEKRCVFFKKLIVLQPTSPFRKIEHFLEALKLYNDEIDMVVSVKESEANPYYNLFEENSKGYLDKSKDGIFTRRQDCLPVYQYNGSIYIVNVESLKQCPESNYKKVRKYVMPEYNSIDLDTEIDWKWAEFLITNKLV